MSDHDNHQYIKYNDEDSDEYYGHNNDYDDGYISSSIDWDKEDSGSEHQDSMFLVSLGLFRLYQFIRQRHPSIMLQEIGEQTKTNKDSNEDNKTEKEDKEFGKEKEDIQMKETDNGENMKRKKTVSKVEEESSDNETVKSGKKKTTQDPYQYSTNDDSPGIHHVQNSSDVFVGNPDATFKVPLEEYFTDNLLPVAEGEESNSSAPQPLSSTSCGVHHSKHLEALHQMHYIKKFEQIYPDSLEFMRYCL